MNRRNVLLGLGTAAAGSGIVFGSGAFTQVQAERDLTIGIDDDSNALLELNPNDDLASVFQASDTGELVIDTRELSSGNEGFNVGSTVLIGETETDLVNRNPQDATVVSDLSSGSGTGAAFQLINNFENTADSDDEIDIALNLEDLDAGDGTLTLIGTEWSSGSSQRTQIASDGGQTIFSSVSSGNEIYFAIELETESTTDPDDISGNVVFRAGPDLADGFPTDAEEASDSVVNVTQDKTFSGLQAAVDDADQGDLIQADPGSDLSAVTVSTDNLTIESGGSGSVDTAANRPTINADASVQNRAIKVEASGVTIDGFDVTFDGTESSNSEKYAIRAAEDTSGVLDLTVRNCAIRDIETSDNKDNSGAVRATGLAIPTGSNTASGVSVENCYFSNIKCTETVSSDNSPDDDSKAKGVSLVGEVNDARIVDCTFEGIGIEENSTNGTAKNVTSVAGTEKTRGISIVEGEDGSTISSNFEIARNTFTNLEGTFGQPAIFTGGANDDLGSNHIVEFNNFRHPIDNLNGDGSSGTTLNLRANFYGANQDGEFIPNSASADPNPDVVSPDEDNDGGLLIEREGSGASYNVLDSRENEVDAGSSLSLGKVK